MAQINEQQFLEQVASAKDAYIKAAENFIDALLRLDYKGAMEHSLSAASILGDDVMVYLMEQLYSDPEFEEKTGEYEAIVERLADKVDPAVLGD